MDRQARALSRSLAKHVPAGVRARRVRYDRASAAGWLDVYQPAAAPRTGSATVAWVHGGAWVSGGRHLVGNYLKILAGHGHAVVGIGYTLAPKAHYPTPVLQVGAALTFLADNADRLGLDTSRLVIAGDSAGAQIAAQVATIITSPPYARLVGIAPPVDPSIVRGAILYCGAYDVTRMDLGGPFAGFLRTVLSAYAGHEDFLTDSRFAPASVVNHVTAAFPPTFISVGNADPLREHSHAFAQALRERGVPVRTVFFPDDHGPALPHEYQFDLDTDAGRLALERSLAFLEERASD
jgi:acetyl esterase/lipase